MLIYSPNYLFLFFFLFLNDNIIIIVCVYTYQPRRFNGKHDFKLRTRAIKPNDNILLLFFFFLSLQPRTYEVFFYHEIRAERSPAREFHWRQPPWHTYNNNNYYNRDDAIHSRRLAARHPLFFSPLFFFQLITGQTNVRHTLNV